MVNWRHPSISGTGVPLAIVRAPAGRPALIRASTLGGSSNSLASQSLLLLLLLLLLLEASERIPASLGGFGPASAVDRSLAGGGPASLPISVVAVTTRD